MKFSYAVWVPSLQRDILVTELTTHQQKELIKAIYSPFNYEFVANIFGLLKENIIDNLELGSLTLIDKLVILLKIRSQSISNNVTYSFKCEKCNAEVTTKIVLNSIINTINRLDYIINDVIIKNDDHAITLGIPTIATEEILEKDNFISDNNEDMKLSDLYGKVYIKDLVLFIKKIHLPSTIILLESMNTKERQEVIESLPSALIKKVWDQIQEIKEKLKIPLLDVKCLCGALVYQSHLSITTSEYSDFIKSVFKDDLHNIYQNIYYMVTNLNFNPLYVDQMTPGERDVYWEYYYRDQKKKQEQEGGILPIPALNKESAP